MDWVDRTEDTKAYLAARAEGGHGRFRRDSHNPTNGLYVHWVRNESPFRVHDYQRVPKTEILPMGCAVKIGKFNAGFFNRRDLDDGQLHVTASLVDEPRELWRPDRRGNWLVYRDVFRQIFASERSTDGEAELKAIVRSWLSRRGLLILPGQHATVIQENNAKSHLERISPADFPKAHCEWMHVHRFDEDLFQELVEQIWQAAT